jgi:hypothetical protein
VDRRVRGASGGVLSPRVRKALLRYGPYVVTVAVVVAILRRYPIDEIIRALGAGRASAVLPVAFAFALVQLLLTGLWDTIAVRAVVGGVRYLDLLRVKAGCAVLQSIGFALVVGAYGTWIARSTRSRASVVAGLVLYFAISDLAAGSFFACVSTTLLHVDAGPLIRIGTPIICLVVLTLLLVPERRPIDPEKPSLIGVFRAVPRKQALLQLCGRTLSSAVVVTAIWAGARAFGLAIPYTGALAYMPVIIVVGALPVNVLGFGPVQGVWLLFLKWAPGPQILAYQLAWNIAILVAYLARGAFFVPRILREVAEGRPEPDLDVPSNPG